MTEHGDLRGVPRLAEAVRAVAMINIAYFAMEFSIARDIGSVSLFADSIDFLEDASVNLLVLLALSWSAQKRAQLGSVLAVILLLPAAATLWTAYQKILHPLPPLSSLLPLAGAGALLVNGFCAWRLAPFKVQAGSLTRAAFLSARNDAVSNFAIIIAGALTMIFVSAWPDLVVGLGIFGLNLGAAAEVWNAARRESSSLP
jgi:Co/Zn/Cd efflux system component